MFNTCQFFVLAVLLSLGIPTAAQTIDQQVEDILSLMTLEEKVGQMTQVERSELNNLQDIATYGIGSLLSGGGSAPSPNTPASWAAMYDNYQSIALSSNLGIPLIYGIDAVHGHNNVQGAVIFPHNIGMGCTWNPELVREANRIVAKEVAATGIDWTFAPCIAVPRNERWGRTYEGFGETPEIQQIMAAESVWGLQGEDLAHGETILACAKHFVGDGGTTDGIDQGDTALSEEALTNIHMAGYLDAIDAGVGSIMASYNSWNGEKLHGHGYLLTYILKSGLGFEGFVVSDWKGVDQLDGDYRTAIKLAINAGVDMVMVPDRYEVFIGHLVSLVQDGEVNQTRIDDAVRRILKQKLLLNLWEEPYTDTSLLPSVGSQAHRDVARQAVRESLVLLSAKNDILPLQKDGQTIMVAGTLAADLGAQCGGWTIFWQGGNGDITTGTNILAGIQNLAGNSQIIHAPNGDYNGNVDVAVVVIGEKTPYAEGAGDRASLLLDGNDVNLLKKLKEEGIPTVAVLVSGRPMIVGEALPYTDALAAAWYPGTEGAGIAEVLFGDYSPSGQLTHTWPFGMSQVPVNVNDVNYAPLFPYQHGLQNFPTAASAENIEPYAAATSRDGYTISLSLSGGVTSMGADAADFDLKINGQSVAINSVDLADYDNSTLVFSLDNAAQREDEITVSYSGTDILSNTLLLINFVNFPVYNTVNSHVVPGRVEAEDFSDMSGVQTEPCFDLGGGENVGYIEQGDWLTYDLWVTQSGTYQIRCRIAGYAGGTLPMTFSDTIQTQVYYSSTNGWQNWQDFTTTVNLEAGFHTMRLDAQSDEFNLNYFDFELVSANTNEPTAGIQGIRAHPNPTDGPLVLEFFSTNSQEASIKLISASGKLSHVIHNGRLSAGLNTFTFPIPAHFPTGVYFIEIKDGTQRYFEKVVKR